MLRLDKSNVHLITCRIDTSSVITSYRKERPYLATKNPQYVYLRVAVLLCLMETLLLRKYRLAKRSWLIYNNNARFRNWNKS